MSRRTLVIGLLLCSFLIASCSTQNSNTESPYHEFNKRNYQFNQHLKKIFNQNKKCETKKASFFAKRAQNFFDNIDEISNMGYAAAQLKPRSFFTNLWRFIINSTIGIAGLFDPATKLGLPKKPNSFALTLAYYEDGKPSTFLVMPFIGPTTARSVFSAPIEFFLSPWKLFNTSNTTLVRIPLRIYSQQSKKQNSCSSKTNNFDSHKDHFIKQRKREIKKVLE